MTRRKHESENLHPGTRSADDWLMRLADFQECEGWGAIPQKADDCDYPLRQWIERMRRMANAGRVSISLAMHLARFGILLRQDTEKQRAAGRQAEAAFDRNMQALREWMRTKAGWMRGEVDITYAETRTDWQCRKCYTFLEHMRLKLNQSLLPDRHLGELLRLPLRVNGQAIGSWLDEKHALRDEAMTDLEPVIGAGSKRTKLLTAGETQDHFSMIEDKQGVIYFPGEISERDQEATPLQQENFVGAMAVRITGGQVMPIKTAERDAGIRNAPFDLNDRVYRFHEDGPGAPVIVFNYSGFSYGVLAVRDAPQGCIANSATMNYFIAAIERGRLDGYLELSLY